MIARDDAPVTVAAAGNEGVDVDATRVCVWVSCAAMSCCTGTRVMGRAGRDGGSSVSVRWVGEGTRTDVEGLGI